MHLFRTKYVYDDLISNGRQKSSLPVITRPQRRIILHFEQLKIIAWVFLSVKI